jgi:hypothetical protein
MPDPDFETAEEFGHEPVSVNARAISASAAIFVGGIFAALLLMAGWVLYLAAMAGGEARIGPAGKPVAPPPGIPSVDADQAETLLELRARENALLSEYGWVDAEEGVARIPIARAMEILSRPATLNSEALDHDKANE